MKRVFILALVICFFILPAFAEEIDLSVMSLDELQALSHRLIEEIESRFLFESAPFGSGVHIGGKSIKVGTYTFTCTEAFNYCYMIIWNSEEDYAEGLDGETIYIKEGQILTIYFGEGTVIKLNGVSGLISPVTAPWAP